MILFKNVSGTFFRKRTVFLLIIIMFCASGMQMNAKFKIIIPDKNNVLCGDLLSKEGELDIGDFIDQTKLNRKNHFNWSTVRGNPNLLVLMFMNKALIIDQIKRKIVQKIELEGIERIIKIRGLDFFLVIHNSKIDRIEKKMMSRFNPGAKNASWTVPFNIIFGYGYSYSSVYRKYSFPGKFRYFKESKTLFFAGIGISKNAANKRAKGRIVNRLIFIDINSGKIKSETDYTYRREIKNGKEILVNTKENQFEIFDFSTGKKGKIIKYTDSEFPDKSGRYLFVDPGRVIGMSRFAGQWEFSFLKTAKGLLLTARKFKNLFKFGVTESYWHLYNEESGEWEKIDPAPLGSIDMALRNFSGKIWPVIVPQIIYQSGFRKSKSNSYWIIRSDGSMKRENAPASIPEKKIYFTFNPFGNNNWIHDTEYLYLLSSLPPKLFKKVKPASKLFRVRIGSVEADLIYQCKEDEPFTTIFTGEKSYLVLSGSFSTGKRILLKIPEGKPVPEAEYSLKLGTFIWRYVLEKRYFETWKNLENTRYLKKNLSRNGFPLNFKKFLWYRPLRMITVYTIPSIWGKYEGYTDLRDMGLVPMIMKDRTTVVSGVNIKDNRVEFYFPVVNINNSKFLRRVLIMNRKEASIAALTDLSTITFYKLKRPH